MMLDPDVKIVDITKREEYEKYLYKCLAPTPFRKYKKRTRYLENAIPRRFHKFLLIFRGDVVGQIEYAPAEACGYPIFGENIVVMNCIWVLGRVRGHGFGKLLLNTMIEKEKDASGFTTLALENHWSPWLKKKHMEKLGFTSIDFVKVKHIEKHKGECFKIHLMWLPAFEGAKPPEWDKSKLLCGVDFCLAHPLYRPERFEGRKIFQIC